MQSPLYFVTDEYKQRILHTEFAQLPLRVQHADRISTEDGCSNPSLDIPMYLNQQQAPIPQALLAQILEKTKQYGNSLDRTLTDLYWSARYSRTETDIQNIMKNKITKYKKHTPPLQADTNTNLREAIQLCIIKSVQYIVHRQYTTYIKQDAIITIR